MAHSRVAALDKGASIACEPRLAANHLWGSDTCIEYDAGHEIAVYFGLFDEAGRLGVGMNL